MKSDVFIQRDDLWVLHCGYDLDNVLVGAKIIFPYLCLVQAGCQIRIGIYYGVYDARYHKRYELAARQRLTAPRRTIYLGLTSEPRPCPPQLKATFKGRQHLTAESAVLCVLVLVPPFFLVSCSFARTSPPICRNTRDEIS